MRHALSRDIADLGAFNANQNVFAGAEAINRIKPGVIAKMNVRPLIPGGQIGIGQFCKLGGKRHSIPPLSAESGYLGRHVSTPVKTLVAAQRREVQNSLPDDLSKFAVNRIPPRRD
jgi:hypothetical protein